jgi:PTH1 family peptidyl-tRNA hydrolase
LGNPGKEYAGTRHNIGFEVLDRLASLVGLGFKPERKWNAEVVKTPRGLFLLKPQTYMNLSGRAAAAAARFYKIAPEEILVVYDDASLPLGQLRLRARGGAGGHNGMRSLIADLGTEDFPRLKIGIGGAPGEKMTGHVLGRFREDEREAAEKALARAVEAVQLAVSDGVSTAANTFNVREKPPKPKEDEQEIRGPDCSEHEG